MASGAAHTNKQEARERIQRKLGILEEYQENGVPANAFIPRSINQFRYWEDVAMGLQRIGSPNTMSAKSSPHNSDLIDAVKKCLDALSLSRVDNRLGRAASKSAGQAAKNAEIRKLEEKLALTENINANLASDWHRSQAEVAAARVKLGALERRNRDLNVEISELRSKLAALDRGGLRSVD